MPGGANRGAWARDVPLRFQVRNGQVIHTIPEAVAVHGGAAPGKFKDDRQAVDGATNRTGPRSARADIQPPQPAHLQVKLRGNGREYLAATVFFTCVLAVVGLCGYGLVVAVRSALHTPSSTVQRPAAKLDFDTSALYEACERVVRSRLHYPTSFSVKLFTTSYGRSTTTNEPLVRFDFDALNGFGLRVPQVARCIQRATGLEVYVDVE